MNNNEPKVFKMNDCDWVCAFSKQEAVDFYSTQTGESDIYLSEVEECNIDQCKMNYGFDFNDYSKNNNRSRIFDILNENKKEKYSIQKDPTCSNDAVILIPFKYVIGFEIIDGNEPPFIIASTEW